MNLKNHFSLPITIRNTLPTQADAVYETIKAAYGVPPDEFCDDCISPEAALEQIQRFPEGQFVAILSKPDGSKQVVGAACTMRINRPPTESPRAWTTEIGTMGIANHVSDGEWLYGVEMGVRHEYQGQGVGTALYKARFDLVKRLNLKGWYSGGQLGGYVRYADQMTPLEYGNKVIARELVDPTVTMQMNRGFEAWQVIEDYMDEPEAGNAAVLIVWYNPDYVSQ